MAAGNISILIVLIISIKLSMSEDCGKSFNAPKPNDTRLDRIVGGTDSKPGAWPWMAALAAPLRIVNKDKTIQVVPDFKCGGSLISDRLVLTAAHCSDEDIYLVRLGVNSLDDRVENPTDILVRKMIVHENFQFPKTPNDIALILLSKRVTFSDRIQPICLPRSELFRNSTFENTSPYVAGWGDVNPGEGQGSLVLKEVQLPIWKLERCRDEYAKRNGTITNENICAGYEGGGRDACQGDSGGPFMMRSKDDEDTFYVIGVVSFGTSCALPNVPGVFTRVDSYLPWIDAIIEKVRSARNNKAARRSVWSHYLKNPNRRFLDNNNGVDSDDEIKVRYQW